MNINRTMKQFGLTSCPTEDRYETIRQDKSMVWNLAKLLCQKSSSATRSQMAFERGKRRLAQTEGRRAIYLGGAIGAIKRVMKTQGRPVHDPDVAATALRETGIWNFSGEAISLQKKWCAEGEREYRDWRYENPHA